MDLFLRGTPTPCCSAKSWRDAGMPGDFIGHFYVRTNFTGCRGLGYVTDFASGAQAYLPYFGDNLDEGSVPANNTKPVE